MNDRIKQAEAELAAAIQAEAVLVDYEAKCARFCYDNGLALATMDLIGEAAALITEQRFHHGSPMRLALYRKELQPLAESYGVKIILVGDKTTATVVLA